MARTSDLLRTRPSPERLYYQVDGHLSGDGQPWAAQSIADWFGSNAFACASSNLEATP